MPERLERSLTNRMWSGVCGGIAEYFSVDAGVIRAFFVIATILTAGLFLIVYVALIVIMPLPGRPGPLDPAPPPAGPSAGADETQVLPPPSQPHSPEEAARRRQGVGWLLVALGVIFLLANAGAFRFIDFRYVWPIALIALGAFIVLQRSRP